MTSNLGAENIMERFSGATAGSMDDVYESTRRDVLQLLRHRLRPEFLNRVDEVLVFRPLSRGDLHRIVEVQFERMIQDNLQRQGLDGMLTPRAKDWLAEQGYDPAFGARPLKRLMLKEIVNALSTRILRGELPRGAFVRIDADEQGLTFSVEQRERATM
jgi:ATP-dependent Clp protease ATP-binding subunit ClpB